MKLSSRIFKLLIVLSIATSLLAIGSVFIFDYFSSKAERQKEIYLLTEIEPSLKEEILFQTYTGNNLARDFLLYELIEKTRVDFATIYPVGFLNSAKENYFDDCKMSQNKILVCKKKNTQRLASFIPLDFDGKQLGHLSLEKEIHSYGGNFTLLKHIGLTLFSILLINIIGIYFFLKIYIQKDFNELYKFIKNRGQGQHPQLKTKEYSEVTEIFKHSMNKQSQIDLLKAKLKYTEKISGELRQIAHDILTPLHSLKILIRELKDPDIFELAQISAEKIHHTVKSILDETNGSTSQVYFHLESVLESVIKEKKIQLAENDSVIITSQFDKNLDTAIVQANKVEFARSMTNILNNAVEALPFHHGEIHISARLFEGVAEIKVEDNGKGIPAHILQHVGTEGFSFQKENGNGLGVGYASNFFRAHNGNFEITSKEKLGTSVLVTIPVICNVDEKEIRSKWPDQNPAHSLIGQEEIQ